MTVDPIAKASSGRFLAVVLLGWIWIQPSSLEATESSSTVRAQPVRLADAGRTKRTTNAPIDKKIEQGILKMVSEHLPEVKVLLERLKKGEPKQYDQAIRTLSRSYKRLEVAKRRDEGFFEVELEVVKSQSAIDLLVAKLTVRDNAADRKSLKKAIERLQAANEAKAKYDIGQLQQRLQRTREQLAAAEKRLGTQLENADSNLERSYANYMRRAGRPTAKTQNAKAARPANPKSSKPAEKPKSEDRSSRKPSNESSDSRPKSTQQRAG